MSTSTERMSTTSFVSVDMKCRNALSKKKTRRWSRYAMLVLLSFITLGICSLDFLTQELTIVPPDLTTYLLSFLVAWIYMQTCDKAARGKQLCSGRSFLGKTAAALGLPALGVGGGSATDKGLRSRGLRATPQPAVAAPVSAPCPETPEVDVQTGKE
eukprot:CAMPEP_0117465634 /NCGR_PEP_ID=MMETSP0784-20121206/4728_1 /TAXON_ID=39447 /ORGANISM="" /LENGTH=156 /DNA_ID=CAMNT_0005259551 /DNA_START=104 /DNA_END=571 /DNA_ORIENTATION=+